METTVKNAVIMTATVLLVIFFARQIRPLENIVNDALGI